MPTIPNPRTLDDYIHLIAPWVRERLTPLMPDPITTWWCEVVDHGDAIHLEIKWKRRGIGTYVIAKRPELEDNDFEAVKDRIDLAAKGTSATAIEEHVRHRGEQRAVIRFDTFELRVKCENCGKTVPAAQGFQTKVYDGSTVMTCGLECGQSMLQAALGREQEEIRVRADNPLYISKRVPLEYINHPDSLRHAPTESPSTLDRMSAALKLIGGHLAELTDDASFRSQGVGPTRAEAIASRLVHIAEKLATVKYRLASAEKPAPLVETKGKPKLNKPAGSRW